MVDWLRQQQWSWAIRVKSDLKVMLSNGHARSVVQLLLPSEQAYLHENVQVFDDIAAHLATAQRPDAKNHWAILSDQPPSLQTFALYGQRFGGIEPHFRITSLLPSGCGIPVYATLQP